MPFPRATGILLHPTSLPARGGVGDFGPAAYAFVDFLAAARQGLWQVLPLGPLGYGNSPYSATSAFAGNPLLISLERLAEHGWIDRSLIAQLPEANGPVEYPAVFPSKMPLLAQAARNFARTMQGNARARFERFRQENTEWLEDFVLFDALRAHHKLANWNEWPRELAHREPAALEKARRDMADDLMMRRVLQFAFAEQWRALRHYCAQRSIRIMGDIAIFVNYDSADVWMHPELFRLDGDRNPEVVSGVPPDFFSATGQRWGNPLYRWDVMKQQGYPWWVARLRAATQHCDYIRLDHFRGFAQFWEIAASEPTAIHGHWVDGPKDDLFVKVREALGGLPFFAEDLGYITADVHALRRRLQIPGMAVLQFGFGDVGAHMYLPQQLTPDTVVYTGTHDNDTLVGWWSSGATPDERRNAEAYFGCAADGMHWSFVRAAQGSVASLSVIPLQDMLGLGSEARMNTPSQNGGNWRWRLQPGALTRDLAARLALLAEVTDRLPQPLPVPPEEEFAA
ncbi:MAG TPA: 4-alpha-glucanotransferase [Bryobacteraceae bacterium]|jgi:4-alpha-glucanotransferase|nr:4-alpha-glucanotransferase [Bryobacteraceae bacterium]